MSAPGPSACGSALKLGSNYQASIRFRGAISGLTYLSMTRPLLEFVVRRLIEKQGNISLISRCRVTQLLESPERTAVTGVRYDDADGRGTELAADFIVDASSRGTLTLELLDRIRLPRPEERQIGIDLHYAAAKFRIPSSRDPDWRAVLHRPSAQSGRGGLLVPVEDNCWQVNLSHMHGGAVPENVADFVAFARTLRTQTIYGAIKDAVPIGPIYRFVFPCSARRRFESLERFPDYLLPLGDAICQFSPTIGQGMSVAAQQAGALRRLVEARVSDAQPLKGLARSFYAAIDGFLTAPWAMAESDFIYEKTRGQRPHDFRERMNFNAALQRLAREDATVHQVMSEVSHLARPSSALRAPRDRQPGLGADGCLDLIRDCHLPGGYPMLHLARPLMLVFAAFSLLAGSASAKNNTARA